MGSKVANTPVPKGQVPVAPVPTQAEYIRLLIAVTGLRLKNVEAFSQQLELGIFLYGKAARDA